MHVVVAEQRRLPAAEGVEGHRHRDRHVDADHAHLDLVCEFARRVAVTREDGGAVAILMLVDHGRGLLVGIGTDDGEHGAEDLFLVDLHVGRHVVEQRAADEIAVLIALELDAAAIDDELGTFGDTGVDVTLHLLLVLPGDERTHLGFGVGAGSNLQRAHLGLEPGDQGVRRLLADGDSHRDRHAALAGGAIGRTHQRIDRLVHVGIRHDDHVVLGTTQCLAALAGARRSLIDVAGNGRRADEAHRLDVGRVQDGVDRLLVAVDDVEHAIGQARFLEPLRQQQRGGGIALGRLQDEAVAGGQRHGEHPHRHHGGEIERRDAGDHTQRLAQGMAVDAGADVLGHFALQQLRGGCREFDDFGTALDLALGVRQHLAVLGGDDGGKLVGARIEDAQKLVEDAGAAQRRRGCPGREGLLGHRDGLVHLSGGGERHGRRLLAGRRVEDGRGAALSGHFVAADEERNGLGHGESS